MVYHYFEDVLAPHGVLLPIEGEAQRVFAIAAERPSEYEQ